MASYSVATTKDHLSSLIDKALAGEEVVITRRGKPMVELRVVAQAPDPRLSRSEWLERMRKLRDAVPASGVSYLDLKKMDEADGLL